MTVRSTNKTATDQHDHKEISPSEGSSINRFAHRTRQAIFQQRALLWHRWYWLCYTFANWRAQYKSLIVVLMYLISLGMTIYGTPHLQNIMEPYFQTKHRLDALQAVLLSIGGALIGAAAISFSLVMFAMQANLERMPHNLFRQFSNDRQIMSAFLGIFTLGIVVACLSLIHNSSFVALLVLTAFWATTFIISLVIYAYRRVLVLISPIEQLTKIVIGTDKVLSAWARRAERARPLFSTSSLDDDKNEIRKTLSSSRDMALCAYWQYNSHWTSEPCKAIDHAIAFARRYASQGDYTVSAKALKAIVIINASYVRTKGKTFFDNNMLISNPLSIDGFINDTLEAFRQLVGTACARRDEQQLEQTVEANEKLISVYMDIDYGSPHATKYHASLASRYLFQGVQAALQHGFVDVVMHGLRSMGRSGVLFVTKGDIVASQAVIDNIQLVTCGAVLREQTRSITLTGVEQLATLALAVLTADRDIHHATNHLRRSLLLVAKTILAIPDTALTSVHSSYLAPYYSGARIESFQSKLTNVANALIEAPSDDETAARIIHNISIWSDGMHQNEKNLLLLAIEKRSSLTFDLVRFIIHITKLLLALSNSQNCSSGTSNQLGKHAHWLISTLSWIPNDFDTIVFMENAMVTEVIFEIALYTQQNSFEECATTARQLMLDWAFKAAKHETDLGILENSFYGLAALTAMADSPLAVDQLKADISKRLECPVNQEQRDKTAGRIRHRAATLCEEGHWSSPFEQAMAHAPHDVLLPLLEDLASLLST